MTATLYIGADNSVVLDGLQNTSTELYVNSGATLTFTLYRIVCRDLVTTAASTTVTSVGAPFVAGDASRSVVVLGVGSNGSDLRTTISSYTDTSTVVLASAPSLTSTYTELQMSVTSATAVSMSYVTSSNGKYRGTLDDSVALKDGELYWVEISIDAGSDVIDFRRFDARARYRT